MKDCFLRRTKLVRYLALFLVSVLCILSCIQVGGTAAADQKAKAQNDTVTFENYEHDALTLMLITTEPIAADSIKAELTLHVESVERMSPTPTTSTMETSSATETSSAIETETSTQEETESVPESSKGDERPDETETSETEKQEDETVEPTEHRQEETETPDLADTEIDTYMESPETEEFDIPDTDPEEFPDNAPEENTAEPEPEIHIPDVPDIIDDIEDMEDDNEDGVLSGEDMIDLAGAAYRRSNEDERYIPEDVFLDTFDLAPNCRYIDAAEYYRTVYTLDGLKGATFMVTLRVDGPDSYMVTSTVSSSIDAADNSIYTPSNGDSSTDSLTTFTITTVKQQQQIQTQTADFSLRDTVGKDAYTFGIIANTVTIGSDTEANLATDELKPNSHTVGPTYADIALPIYAKTISDNSGNLQLHSNVSAVYTGEKFEIDSGNSGIYRSADGKKQITNVDSNTIIMQSENYVNVDAMLSSISSSFDSYYDMPDSTGVIISFNDMNNSIIDTTQSGANPAIVNVTTSNLNWVQSGGLKITTAPGQTVIINVNGSDDLYLREYRINGINSAKNDDGSYADHIIWNFSSAYTGNIAFYAGGCGTFVAPNATASIHATSSGRIYVDSFYNPGGEWHSFYTPDPEDPLPDPPVEFTTEPATTETSKPVETSTEEPATETETYEETTEPTEVESSIEETTEPSETESYEETTEPTETSTEEITEPTETESSEKATEPSETESSEEATEPTETSTEDVTEPTETESYGETTEPTETSIEEVTESTETESSEEATEPSETESSEEATELTETSTEEVTEITETSAEEINEPEETSSGETTSPEAPSETLTEPISSAPEETATPAAPPEPVPETTQAPKPSPTLTSTSKTPTDIVRKSAPADPFTPSDPPDTMMLLSSDDDLIALNAAPDMLLSSDDSIPLSAPKTGDESNPILSLCTLFASAFILAFLLFRRKASSLEDDGDM